jgi:hypothetical protein
MLQRLGVVNPKHILQRFLEKRCPKLYPRKRLQRLPMKKVLLFLLLQLFWAYCNTFRALKQGQNLVVFAMPSGHLNDWSTIYCCI